MIWPVCAQGAHFPVFTSLADTTVPLASSHLAPGPGRCLHDALFQRARPPLLGAASEWYLSGLY